MIYSLLFSLCFTVFQEMLMPEPLHSLEQASSCEEKVLFFCGQREAVPFSRAFPERYVSVLFFLAGYFQHYSGDNTLVLVAMENIMSYCK